MDSNLAVLRASTLGGASSAVAESPVDFASLFSDFKPGAPGCAAGVMRNGQLIWSGGFGTANLATGQSIKVDTLFNLASVSKQFTGFAILLLAAEGRLDLDDSIRRFLPELPAYAEGIRIRHLLQHTSGLQDYMVLTQLAGIALSERFTQEQAFELLARQDAGVFLAGSEYSYSNSGYVLLSTIVERAAGQSLKAFSQARIFKPLGMKHSSIVDRYPSRLANLAQGYEQAEESAPYEAVETRWEPTGDGQVHSNVLELMLWLRNFATGRVGGKALLAKMRETGRLNDGDPGFYGMGVANLHYRGLDHLSHSGSWAGFNTHVAWYPEIDVATVVLCNSPEPDAAVLGYGLLDRLLGFSTPPQAIDVAPPPSIERVCKAPLSTLVPGVYIDGAGNMFKLVRGAEGYLLETFPEVLPLRQVTEQVLKADSSTGPIYIAATAPGQVVSNNPASCYSLAKPWRPSALAPFVGVYQLETGVGQIEIGLRQRQLFVHQGEYRHALMPLTSGRFDGGILGVISFGQGGAVLTCSIARNLRFKKLSRP